MQLTGDALDLSLILGLLGLDLLFLLLEDFTLFGLLAHLLLEGALLLPGALTLDIILILDIDGLEIEILQLRDKFGEGG